MIQGRFTRSDSAISTPVKPNVLQYLLQGYDTNITKTLVTGFTECFRIPFTIKSDPLKHHIENHKSVRDNQGIVQRKMSKEKAKHRFEGPFSSDPFPNMVYSPLGLVPKKESGEFRLIHDLSFPQTNSVNSHILPEFTTVAFQKLEQLATLGKGAIIAKADLQDAFSIIPVSPLDYRLFGFKFQGLKYFDKSLPMGCSHACQLFELLSQALQWICQHKFCISSMSHILDDLIFCKTQPECHSNLSNFLSSSKLLAYL